VNGRGRFVHTEFLRKFVVALEDFDEMVEYAEVDGDFCRQFFEKVCLFGHRDVKMLRIRIRE
jgi:hypothetical protein